MHKDVMIDIETLGTRHTSSIIQIGACYFDRTTGEIGKTFSMNILHDVNQFTTDQETIDWWEGQPKETQDLLVKNQVPPLVALYALKVFLKDAECLWSHATFDIPILMNAFSVCGVRMPVHYRGMRDIRTLMDLADHHSERVREGVHHNALDDCKFQVGYVVEALNKLKK